MIAIIGVGVFTFAISLASFAAEDDESEKCAGAVEGTYDVRTPSIEVLRRKYLGADAPPLEFGPDRSLTRAGAKFVFGPDGPPKLVLKEYPDLRFDWDSADDSLRLRVARALEPWRARGPGETPEFTVNYEYAHPRRGTTILLVNFFEGFF